MDIIGTGIDIVDLDRVRAVRNIERAAWFILLPEELLEFEQSRDRAQFIATRLALKEAIIKAVPFTAGYHDLIIQKKGDQPQARFVASPNPKLNIAISAAHEFRYAVGHAIVWVS